MTLHLRKTAVLALVGMTSLMCGCTNTYSVDVQSAQKVSDTSGNFANNLHNGDHFGQSLASLNDFNHDGVTDMIVGTPYDDDNGADDGAIYLLFMNTNGQVSSKQKISAGTGNFSGVLLPGDHFGSAVTAIGDLNRDGITDIAVGAPGADDGGTDRGAVWILNMNALGQVFSQQKISAVTANTTVTLHDGDQFGSSVTAIGDLDGDGVTDLAIGAPGDSDGGPGRGAVWILFMQSNGTVKSAQKISNTSGNFNSGLTDGARFGFAVTDMGDLDANGTHDLAVGSPGDNDGGVARGAVWILLLNHDGTVNASQKISQTQGQFDGTLGDGDQFGTSVANIGDLNNDGIPELGVGIPYNSDGGPNRGAIRILFLRSDHTVISSSQISNTQGNFTGLLHDNDQFGSAIVGLGDLNRNGTFDIAVGASLDDDGGTDRGAVWLLSLNSVKVTPQVDKNADLVTLFSGRGN